MAVRGLMRKDDTEEALRVVLLFDFHSKESGNPEGNLKDMQVRHRPAVVARFEDIHSGCTFEK